MFCVRSDSFARPRPYFLSAAGSSARRTWVCPSSRVGKVESFRVIYSNGKETKTGWINRQDAIPFEKALDFFNDELDRNPDAEMYSRAWCVLIHMEKIRYRDKGPQRVAPPGSVMLSKGVDSKTASTRRSIEPKFASVFPIAKWPFSRLGLIGSLNVFGLPSRGFLDRSRSDRCSGLLSPTGATPWQQGRVRSDRGLQEASAISKIVPFFDRRASFLWPKRPSVLP